MMQRLGNVDEKEMFRTFNMGIGMIVIASLECAAAVKDNLGVTFEIGQVVSGNGAVDFV